MKRPIRLSSDFALPLELVTESVAIIARKRGVYSVRLFRRAWIAARAECPEAVEPIRTAIDDAAP